MLLIIGPYWRARFNLLVQNPSQLKATHSIDAVWGLRLAMDGGTVQKAWGQKKSGSAQILGGDPPTLVS